MGKNRGDSYIVGTIPDGTTVKELVQKLTDEEQAQVDSELEEWFKKHFK